jgi:heptosyltransferase-2
MNSVRPNSQKILVIGPSWVGDMVMCHTLFKLLKLNNPGAIIDVLAPAWSQSILERMPEIHKSIVLPFKHGELNLKQRIIFGKKLRAEKYHQVIFIPNSLKSLIIPWAAKIPKKTGWNGKEWPRSWLLNDGRRLDKNNYPLMVERFAALAFRKNAALPAELPWPKLTIDPEARNHAVTKFGLKIDAKPCLMIAPGAEFGPSKRWPVGYFAEVANQKMAEGWQVWLCGSVNDQDIAHQIEKLISKPCVNLVGKTTLSEVIDLMSLASVVLSNDSGLMHIAAAVDRPVVALFGSTSAVSTPPLSKHAKIASVKIDCSPCFKRVCPKQHWRCMLDLKPAQVLPYIHLSNSNHESPSR